MEGVGWIHNRNSLTIPESVYFLPYPQSFPDIEHTVATMQTHDGERCCHRLYNVFFWRHLLSSVGQ